MLQCQEIKCQGQDTHKAKARKATSKQRTVIHLGETCCPH